MRLRHIPRLQAAGSETALLLSSQEHQAADTCGATKQEEKGRGSVRLARPRGLEEHGVHSSADGPLGCFHVLCRIFCCGSQTCCGARGQ